MSDRAHTAKQPTCPGEQADGHCLREGEAARLLAGHPWHRFAVVGDSIAEGLGDPAPGYPDQPWYDRIAAELRAQQPDLAYLNLGKRDTPAAQVRAGQLGPALAFAPDLALVACGGYGLALSRYDAAAVAAELRAIVAAFAGHGCDVITVGLFDGSYAPALPEWARQPMRERLRELSRRTEEISADFGTVHVDLTGHPAARDGDIYSEDPRHGTHARPCDRRRGNRPVPRRAATTGTRPVIEFQIPSLLFLVFEQIVNHAHKFSLMTGGQVAVPVTYIVPGSGSRMGWAGQHSDHPYSIFAHVGIKTVVPAMPSDGYGLLVSAIRDEDPTVIFAPTGAMGVREDVTAELTAVPLGSARIHRPGSDVTVVAVGHLVHDALAVAAEMAGEASLEIFDPRTLYPFDWDALLSSVGRTRRLVVIDDSNRYCGFSAEVIATVAEEMQLAAPPRRVTRPEGAVLPFALELDRAVQPSRDQLVAAVRAVMK